jgi:hypothetical protein
MQQPFFAFCKAQFKSNDSRIDLQINRRCGVPAYAFSDFRNSAKQERFQ